MKETENSINDGYRGEDKVEDKEKREVEERVMKENETPNQR